jgi:hypothetical protein
LRAGFGFGLPLMVRDSETDVLVARVADHNLAQVVCDLLNNVPNPYARATVAGLDEQKESKE